MNCAIHVCRCSLNSRFGTIAVPNIMVFHNAKAVARFNGTERTLTNIAAFVANITGYCYCTLLHACFQLMDAVSLCIYYSPRDVHEMLKFETERRP